MCQEPLWGLLAGAFGNANPNLPYTKIWPTVSKPTNKGVKNNYNSVCRNAISTQKLIALLLAPNHFGGSQKIPIRSPTRATITKVQPHAVPVEEGEDGEDSSPTRTTDSSSDVITIWEVDNAEMY